MDEEKTEKTYRLLLLLNSIAFLAMVSVNYLSISLPLNGLDNAMITELYPNLFTPAGFAFSIWGPIYLLLGFFVLYQARGLIKPSTPQISSVHQIGPLFFISSLFNISWIFSWHYLQVGLSLLSMTLLLSTLLCLYHNLHRGEVDRDVPAKLIHVAFSLYVGWITIAMVANVTVFFVHIGWGGFGLSQSLWMVLITVVATLILLSFLFKNRDWVYGLVGVWALWGILSKRLAQDPLENTVIVVVSICLALLLGGSIKTMIESAKTHSISL